MDYRKILTLTGLQNLYACKYMKKKSSHQKKLMRGVKMAYYLNSAHSLKKDPVRLRVRLRTLPVSL